MATKFTVEKLRKYAKENSTKSQKEILKQRPYIGVYNTLNGGLIVFGVLREFKEVGSCDLYLEFCSYLDGPTAQGKFVEVTNDSMSVELPPNSRVKIERIAESTLDNMIEKEIEEVGFKERI